MKKVTLVQASEVEVKPFNLADFSAQKADEKKEEKISKKTVRRLAKEMGLRPSDEELLLAKKLLEAYVAKR